MITTTLARRRGSLCALLLLAVVATLLPALHAAAQTIPRPPIINLTRQEVRAKAYQWWLDYEYERRHNYNARHVLESVLQSSLVADHLLHDDAARYDIDVVIKQAGVLQERYYQRLGPRGADPAYRATLPTSVLGEALFAAALENPVFRDSARRIYQQERNAAPVGLESTDAPIRAYYKTFLEGNLLAEASRTLLQEKLDRAVERAEGDPQFARAWDKYFAPGLGLKLETFDAREFLAAHPEVPIAQEIRGAIRPDGTMQISLETLEQLAKAEFNKINSSIDEIQTTLGEISRQQGELVDYMRDEQKRRQDQAKVEAANKRHQLRIQAAGASVSIIANLISIADPEAGRQFATVGTAAVTVADSLRNWMEAVAGLNGLSKLTSLSTVVMTGNVLGAVLSVVSLFGESQPTPEQMILEEIGRLRQQVNELRTEMHDRFDRVDSQLNTIYTTMHQRFDQIDVQLGKINGRLDEIQASLLTLGLALDRIERNNFEYLDALGRRPLREAMHGALGYQQRTGLEMPYRPEFVGYENSFHSWATIHAFDALSAGPTERDYSDAAVLRELSGAPLDANLNYLNGWLVARGMQPFATRRLPGLRDWTFASRAYAELGFDWPEHLARISPQRQAALDAIGGDLEQALQNISTIQTPGGPQGNAPLFAALTANYRAKLDALDGELRASEAAFVKDVQTALGHKAPFDLFGGLDQTLSLAFWPAEFGAIRCGVGNHPPLAGPTYLHFALSGYSRFALAEYLQVRPLKVCVDSVWTNEYDQCAPNPQNCERRATPQVTLTVYSNNVELLRRAVTGYPQRLDDVKAVVRRDWDSFYRPRLDAIFSSSPPVPLSPAGEAELAAVSTALASRLVDHQRAYAGRVLSGLNSGPLQARAVELGGAKKLIESFATLGLSQAVNSDDFLRSLLFSEEALVDNQQVALAYAALAAGPQGAPAAAGEAQPQANPRVALLSAGTKRREALSSLLTDYLGGISTDNYREDNALVAGARFDLQLARAFATSGDHRAFLPLLRR